MFSLIRLLVIGGLVGKGLGIARELISAAMFGTGSIASAYRVSQAAILIPLNGPASDALNAGFIPNFRLQLTSAPERARAMFAALHAILLVVSTVIGFGTFCFAEEWIWLLAPGIDASTSNVASQMVKVLAVAMPVYVLSILYASAELAAGGGRLAAMRASIQSFGLIMGTIWAWYFDRPRAIAVGFLFAYIVIAAIGAKHSHVSGLRFWPTRAQCHVAREPLMKVWNAVKVVIWVPVIMQIHFIFERRVASVVAPEAVAALDYARFITDTIVLLVAMPVGMAGLALMSSMSVSDFRASSRQSIQVVVLLGIPISAVLAVHSELVVSMIFARGAFDNASVSITASILFGMALGLWGQLLGYAATKFMNARGDNRSVVVFTTLAVGINLAINLFASSWLGPATLGVAAGANGVLFGMLAVWRVGALRYISTDLIVFCIASLGYAFIWQVVPKNFGANVIAVLGVAATYWGCVLLGVPRHRRVVEVLLRRLGGARGVQRAEASAR